MRIPQTYQNQALSSQPTVDQTQQKNQEQNSVSLRLGKLGITYTSQDTPRSNSTSTDTGQSTALAPSTSFAQELSLALAQSSASVTDTDFSSWSTQNTFSQRMGLQAYTFQAQTMSAVSTQNINAMV